jgi:hypothetical protein
LKLNKKMRIYKNKIMFIKKVKNTRNINKFFQEKDGAIVP